MSWNGVDRRKFPRVAYPCMITMRHDKGAKDVLLTHTDNIGIGGVGIVMKFNVKMFTPVELEIDLLDTNEHIKCAGKVVWSIQRGQEGNKANFYDVGIEFIDMKNNDFERIEEIVKRLSEHKNQALEES